MITNGMAERNVHRGRKPVKNSEPRSCTAGPRARPAAALGGARLNPAVATGPRLPPTAPAGGRRRALAARGSTRQSRQVRDSRKQPLQLGEETQAIRAQLRILVHDHHLIEEGVDPPSNQTTPGER